MGCRAASCRAAEEAAEQLDGLQSNQIRPAGGAAEQLYGLKIAHQITKQMPTKITQIPQQTTNNRTAEGER
jgi:hypothetical protein